MHMRRLPGKTMRHPAAHKAPCTRLIPLQVCRPARTQPLALVLLLLLAAAAAKPALAAAQAAPRKQARTTVPQWYTQHFKGDLGDYVHWEAISLDGIRDGTFRRCTVQMRRLHENSAPEAGGGVEARRHYSQAVLKLKRASSMQQGVLASYLFSLLSTLR